jgi:hypothetical protein
MIIHVRYPGNPENTVSMHQGIKNVNFWLKESANQGRLRRLYPGPPQLAAYTVTSTILSPVTEQLRVSPSQTGPARKGAGFGENIWIKSEWSNRGYC